jgi:hypothetical protein
MSPDIDSSDAEQRVVAQDRGNDRLDRGGIELVRLVDDTLRNADFDGVATLL